VITLVTTAAGIARMMRNSTASRFSSPGCSSIRTGKLFASKANGGYVSISRYSEA
jgi:hypothetical protein